MGPFIYRMVYPITNSTLKLTSILNDVYFFVAKLSIVGFLQEGLTGLCNRKKDGNSQNVTLINDKKLKIYI